MILWGFKNDNLKIIKNPLNEKMNQEADNFFGLPQNQEFRGSLKQVRKSSPTNRPKRHTVNNKDVKIEIQPVQSSKEKQRKKEEKQRKRKNKSGNKGSNPALSVISQKSNMSKQSILSKISEKIRSTKDAMSQKSRLSQRKRAKEIANNKMKNDKMNALQEEYKLWQELRANSQRVKSEKSEDKKMRKWQCKIIDISITNLHSDLKNLFIHFIFASGQQWIWKTDDSGIRKQVLEGEAGSKFKTELFRSLEKDMLRKSKKSLDFSVNKTYEELNRQFLEVEVWEYKQCTLNEFEGVFKLSLKDIAQGPISRTGYIRKLKPDGSKESMKFHFTLYLFNFPQALFKIDFQILFQEIWKFNIHIKDISISNFNLPAIKKEKFHPQVQFRMANRTRITKGKIITTKKEPSERNLKATIPFWSTSEGTYNYEGTMADLEQEDMLVTVNLLKTFRLQQLGSTLINLQLQSLFRGVSEYGIIKAFICIQSKKEAKLMAKKELDEIIEKGGQLDDNIVDLEQQPVSEEEEQEDFGPIRSDSESEPEIFGKLQEEDEKNRQQAIKRIEEEQKYICMVNAIMCLGNLPKYRQKGRLVYLQSDRNYIVVSIGRVENLQTRDERGVINSFVTAEWGSQIQRTRTIDDNFVPEFAETFIYEIPISYNKPTYQSRKAFQANKRQQLEKKLKNKNTINIDLWIDGKKIQLNDNLGTVKINISEIQKGGREEIEYRDHKTHKTVKYITQVFSEMMTLKSNVEGISVSISLKAYFQFESQYQSKENQIDVSKFVDLQTDPFPQQVYENMKIATNVMTRDNSALQKHWNQKIAQNFAPLNPPDVGRMSILKDIFVMDQYNRIHFLCLYMKAFTAPSNEHFFEEEKDEERRRLMKEDTKLETMQEIAYFVSNIPFLMLQNWKLWQSPDFLLTLQVGDLQDHVLLLACLFMGRKDAIKTDETTKPIEEPQEDKKEKKEKSENTNEDRVFICIGRLKKTMQRHCWVMTMNGPCNLITFWEIVNGKQYTFGRPNPGKNQLGDQDGCGETRFNAKKLKKFLSNYESKSVKTEEKDAKEKNAKQEDTSKEEVEIPKSKRKTFTSFLPAEKEQKKLNKSRNSHLSKFDFHNQFKQAEEETVVDINHMPQVTITNSILIIFQKVFRNKTYLLNKTYFQSEGTQKPTRRNTTQGKDYLASRKAKDENAIREMNDQHLHPHHFSDEQELPYYSIEIIFNNRNAYANLQNHDPNLIFYDIQDSSKWFPYVWTKDDIDNEEQNQEMLPWKTWNNKFSPFYSLKNMTPPLKIKVANKLLSKIMGDIKFGIQQLRSQQQQSTKFKDVKDPIIFHFQQLLRLQEYKDTKRTEFEFEYYNDFEKLRGFRNKKNQSQENEGNVSENDQSQIDFEEMEEKEDPLYKHQVDWQTKLRKYLPVNFSCKYVQMLFSSPEPEKIKLLMQDHHREFLLDKNQPLVLAVAGKIFTYPNEIISVRIVIAKFFNDPTLNDETSLGDIEEDSQEGNSFNLDDQ